MYQEKKIIPCFYEKYHINVIAIIMIIEIWIKIMII